MFENQSHRTLNGNALRRAFASFTYLSLAEDAGEKREQMPTNNFLMRLRPKAVRRLRRRWAILYSEAGNTAR
jgi:hypothetical protein